METTEFSHLINTRYSVLYYLGLNTMRNGLDLFFDSFCDEMGFDEYIRVGLIQFIGHETLAGTPITGESLAKCLRTCYGVKIDFESDETTRFLLALECL